MLNHDNSKSAFLPIAGRLRERNQTGSPAWLMASKYLDLEAVRIRILLKSANFF